MKILVTGGDGFCGWPTALGLASAGHSVLILDNLTRRNIDNEISSNSITPIASIKNRVYEANKLVGEITFANVDVAANPLALRDAIKSFHPDAIVHFAEQRSAPYSMIGDKERCYTVNNNISSTHNICSAIVDIDRNIHLVHLGTMGVYGYSDVFGNIPEGYLGVTIDSTGKSTEILYPTNPGSIYHLTKSMDQLLFQFYHKNWRLKVTDLHQGIVWGTQTEETVKSDILINRFDYDGIFGTVLNRFIVQAANQHPLTVYGTGGQKRAFIHISDTARCIKLAIENPTSNNERVRIFNQVSEVHSVIGLANLFKNQFGCEINAVENPRKELAENDLVVDNSGLKNLGFNPILLSEGLTQDVGNIARVFSRNFDQDNVLTSPKWV